MRILREVLGDRHEIDLGTEQGWNDFSISIVQDDELAHEYVDRLRSSRRGTLIANADEPEWVERYTILSEDPIFPEKTLDTLV